MDLLTTTNSCDINRIGHNFDINLDDLKETVAMKR
jgi:hypothetical protein